MKKIVIFILVGLFLTASLFCIAKTETSSNATDDGAEENINLNDTIDIINANNAFATEFYSKIKGENGNIFFSPYSISTAFAMTYEGANNKTAEEIQKVFHFPVDKEKRQNSIAALESQINRGSKDYTLYTANGLWILRGDFYSEYKDTLKQYYGSDATYLNPSNLEAARTTINNWVSNKTNKMIPELLSKSSLDVETKAVLTNAIYFKGNWMLQFNKSMTSTHEFYLKNGGNINVPMMYHYESHPKNLTFSYAETDDLQLLMMPYKGKELSMLVILPKENDITIAEKQLSSDSLNKWNAMLVKRNVEISFPKFKMQTEYELSKDLSDMGMADAFDPMKADFSGMAPEPIFLQKAIHKAVIDVNEEGTEAAAATAIMVGVTSVSDIPVFNANHPFLFVIQQNDTGNILFIGRVSDPTK